MYLKCLGLSSDVHESELHRGCTPPGGPARAGTTLCQRGLRVRRTRLVRAAPDRRLRWRVHGFLRRGDVVPGSCGDRRTRAAPDVVRVGRCPRVRRAPAAMASSTAACRRSWPGPWTNLLLRGYRPGADRGLRRGLVRLRTGGVADVVAVLSYRCRRLRGRALACPGQRDAHRPPGLGQRIAAHLRPGRRRCRLPPVDRHRLRRDLLERGLEQPAGARARPLRAQRAVPHVGRVDLRRHHPAHRCRDRPRPRRDGYDEPPTSGADGSMPRRADHALGRDVVRVPANGHRPDRSPCHGAGRCVPESERAGLGVVTSRPIRRSHSSSLAARSSRAFACAAAGARSRNAG